MLATFPQTYTVYGYNTIKFVKLNITSKQFKYEYLFQFHAESKQSNFFGHYTNMRPFHITLQIKMSGKGVNNNYPHHKAYNHHRNC